MTHRDITDTRLPRSHVRNPCFWPHIPRARSRMHYIAMAVLLGLVAVGVVLRGMGL